MTISSLVFLYAVSYMGNDSYRFFYILLMFVLSMGLLVIRPNAIRMLLGWDGLGLVSYCLVVYYQRYGSFNSGIVTVLINRLGDVIILLFVGVMFNRGS